MLIRQWSAAALAFYQDMHREVATALRFGSMRGSNLGEGLLVDDLLSGDGPYPDGGPDLTED